jgi:hypothetical protein
MKKYMILTVIFLLPMLFACSSTKEVSERRSLMMPRLSELPRNSKKYKDVSYTKRDKYQKKMYKKRVSK